MLFVAAVLAAAPHLAFTIPVTRESPAKVEFVTQARRWTAKLTPPETAFDIELPKDNTLTIVAEHFDPFVVTPETKVVALHPQPVLTGRVLDAKNGKPVPAASIERLDGTLLGTTSGDGSFRAYVPEKWPETIVIHASSRARQLVKLPSHRADTKLPPISLRPSAAADLIIDNRDALPAKLHWQAALRYQGGNPDVLERGELAPAQIAFTSRICRKATSPSPSPAPSRCRSTGSCSRCATAIRPSNTFESSRPF